MEGGFGLDLVVDACDKLWVSKYLYDIMMLATDQIIGMYLLSHE